MFSMAASLRDVFARIEPISGELHSSRGNKCIDMPSVVELLVQLTFPGLPAAQYLPKDYFLGFSTIFAALHAH